MADDQNQPTSVEAQSAPDAPDDAQGETVSEPGVTVEALNQSVEALKDKIKALEAAEEVPVTQHVLPHNLSNTTVLMGYTIPLPIYTVVYITLAGFTILEVLISSLPHSILTTIPLIAFSAAKAVLVVLFYMHLKEDSRLFAFALLLPLFIAMVASLFLLTVPIKGY